MITDIHKTLDYLLELKNHSIYHHFLMTDLFQDASINGLVLRNLAKRFFTCTSAL